MYVNRACSVEEEHWWENNGLVFFYGKLGWKITAEKETQQFVKVAAQLETSLRENLGTNWTFRKQCRLFSKWYLKALWVFDKDETSLSTKSPTQNSHAHKIMPWDNHTASARDRAPLGVKWPMCCEDAFQEPRSVFGEPLLSSCGKPKAGIWNQALDKLLWQQKFRTKKTIVCH